MARILTLTNWYPPHHFGGYEVLCHDVMTRLGQRGHAIEVLCSDARLGDVPEEADAHPIHRELKMYWRDGSPWTPNFSEQRAIERANQDALAAVLDRFNPDVVSVWAMGALSLSLLTTLSERQIPIVYAICDEWLIYGIALDPWSRRWQRNPFSRGLGSIMSHRVGLPTTLVDVGSTGFFCFLSSFTRRASQAAAPWRFPRDTVVYPGIDRSSFPPPTTEGPGPWRGNLLYTGRLDQRKGTDTLLRALTHLPPDTTVSFMGRGEADEQARLERMAVTLGIQDRVHFEAIARAALGDAYADHDCLIFPSEWPEPFGLVPLEAMACGTPVVATGTGGSGEYLVDGDNALLFTAGDDKALAAAVSRLAGDDGIRQTLRQGGWQTAAAFDIGSTVDVYEVCHLAAAQHTIDDIRPATDSGPPAFAIVTTAASGAKALSICETHHDAGEEVTIQDLGHIPFSDGTFMEIRVRNVWPDTGAQDPFMQELRRICQAGATVVLEVPNRHNLAHLPSWAHDHWRGQTPKPTGGWTWGDVDEQVGSSFHVQSRQPMGWEARPAGRMASRAGVGPLRAFSKGIRITMRAR
jgi:glycogen(starch) synthase